MWKRKLLILVKVFLLMTMLASATQANSDAGKTIKTLTPNANIAREQRPLLANSKIKVHIECEGRDGLDVNIEWQLYERQCWTDKRMYDIQKYDIEENLQMQNKSEFGFITMDSKTTECSTHPILLSEKQWPVQETTASGMAALSPETAALASVKKANNTKKHPTAPLDKNIITIGRDGIYELTLKIEAVKSSEPVDFSAHVQLDIVGPDGGYLSAIDHPLLAFYGIMCVVYVIFGIIWLFVSFMQWRDLLRIQFWIGGVILLGMLEKAFFYAQYYSLNATGVPVEGAELMAEFVSCAKRTLARMLVIIMSLGFGIVKPRLGPMLHRVVGVGALYFVLACVESYLRVTSTKTDEQLVAAIPLAVLDTGICWWIFTSLVQTTRTLRLRRNMVKLSLYRHFTNTLIFSVLASVIFMLYALHVRKSQNCTPIWRNIWFDAAFWHILFSVLLLVIMILWRPTNNNQRYAFTPLLDAPDDEDDDEEDQFVADAYGVKMRSSHANGGTKTPPNAQRGTTTEEDDLRWVEENIPSSMSEPALPVLDSDEEIINTRFEVSKMQ
ncbi:transmembrane protein 87A [Bactrocera dorsalis]|uniref:Transmembrane protein 87A n=1 Tax=Bactrocera dorsalis TaxID=27457 RepID=A0A6I9VP10_BACDO|nr:transmembrane protein 87A [Bactrocera dorsalis]XP_011205618.2 transmembrane protein 87A [Bactrocera dorsalis]